MTNKDILDWEELSPEDQNRVHAILGELNEIFKQYDEKKEVQKPCDDSISED